MRPVLLIAVLVLFPFHWRWHKHHVPKPDIPPHLFRCSPDLDYWDSLDCAKRLNRVT